LLEAVESAEAGDSLLLRSYVVEEGRSSREVLAALRSAAARGVNVRLGCDRSALSAFTRFCERSTTLQRELKELAACEARVELETGEKPDHSKLFVLHRGAGSGKTSRVILGGVNLGGAWESRQGAPIS
jgi:phosphatidylserine/phosphatidylglycerophosphate/cardiolipin synthase-like enzyme